MSANDDATLLERLTALHDAVAAGKLMEALDEYYAEDVTMQENEDEPTVGLAANKQREADWLATVAEFRVFELTRAAVHDGVSFAETVLEYVTTSGDVVHQEQVSRAVWRDGKIVGERFYHG